MCRLGYDFYLLDWGVYGEEDNGLTVDECVTRLLPRVVRKVLETSGADGLAVIGYCMGAPLSVSFVAQHPEVPVRAYVNMAGPIDFAQAGLFAQWLDKRFYDVDRVVDTVGAIPADWVKVGLQAPPPDHGRDDGAQPLVEPGQPSLRRGLPGALAVGERLRRRSRPSSSASGSRTSTRTTASSGGRSASEGSRSISGRSAARSWWSAPRRTTSRRPACVRALIDHVGSTDKTYFELPGGHISLIAGRSASVHCWPRVSDWLAARLGLGQGRDDATLPGHDATWHTEPH